jgi:ribosomal-protein-alanine N-acetyltransferase
MLTIRSAKLKDLNKITLLEETIFKENAFTKTLLKQLILRSFLFLKLEKGLIKKNLIGFIIILKDKRHRANLINFLIDSQYQRKGYGSYLLKNALRKLKKQSEKIKKIVLNVSIDNISAIQVYTKFGFQICERIKEYYHSGESAYLMELNL